MVSSFDPVLNIQDLRMRYPSSSTWLLDGLNLRLEAGERLALIGSSGCGKSTVARVILQLLPIGSLCEGGLLLTGKDPRGLNQKMLRRFRGEAVGLVFQDPMTRLNPLMTVGEHLLDTLKAHRPETSSLFRRKRAKELLEMVEISPLRFQAYPHEFSGGMRQRLAIALAIALNPPLVIADEPSTSLDVAVADQVMTQLSNLCNELGSTLLLISHDLALASKWCERIAILDKGKIVEEGVSREVLTNPQSLIGNRLVSSARSREGGFGQREADQNLVLEVNRLRCSYVKSGFPWQMNTLNIVDEVSFSINKGETLGVVGASGCGKTTLCKALLGLTPTRGGEVILEGKNMLTLKGTSLRRARQGLQMVFQDPYACLNPKMTVGQAILDPFLIHRKCGRSSAKEKVRCLLEQVGLTPPEVFKNRFPNQLSGGQQQRVAIARALALDPKVLICDESVSMLDAEIQSDVLSLLRSLQQRFGLAMLFITHDLYLASGFCHRVIVLDKGRIVEAGSGEQIMTNPKTTLARRLIETCPKLP